MYGFLRPFLASLKEIERKDYSKFYCSNCTSIGKLFGYKWRLLTSYDSTFLSILISAQSLNKDVNCVGNCAVLPVKKNVIPFESLSQTLPAHISLLTLSAKLGDSITEKKNPFKKKLKELCDSKISNSPYLNKENAKILKELNDTIVNQNIIESHSATPKEINILTNPSSKFVSKLFHYTSLISGNSENEIFLKQIGFHVGKIIYLIDSCIDLFNDLEKSKFNALLASFPDKKTTISVESKEIYTKEIINSLIEIKKLSEQLILYKHRDLVLNILNDGFQMQIIGLIKKSMHDINSKYKRLFHYLPHAAILSAICLMTPQDVSADWVWNKVIPNGSDRYVAYGYTCCTPDKPSNPTTNPCACCDLLGTYADCLINPCVYFDTWKLSNFGKIGICCQIPKSLLLLIPTGYCSAYCFSFICGLSSSGFSKSRSFGGSSSDYNGGNYNSDSNYFNSKSSKYGSSKSATYSVKGSDIFGSDVTKHYDSDGHKTGYSEEGKDFLGNDVTKHYDSDGHKTGYSEKGKDFFGNDVEKHYDADGKRID